MILAVGEAINPRNISWVEKLMGVGKHYNKQLDREDMYGGLALPNKVCVYYNTPTNDAHRILQDLT